MTDDRWFAEGELEAALEHARAGATTFLYGGQLDEFPSELLRMPWLEKLALEGTGLVTIPDGLGELRELRDLDLMGSGVTRLPESVGSLTKLRRLAVGNACRSFPDSIRRCRKLDLLAIGGNRLGFVPDWIADLGELKRVFLWGNSLRELPDWWDRLPGLRWLNLADNELTALPPSLGSLSRLEFLLLDRNQLTDLPGELAGLQSLRAVQLSENAFRELPSVTTTWSRLEALTANGDPTLDVTVGVDEPENPVRLHRSQRDQERQSLGKLETLPEGLRDLPLQYLVLSGNPGLGLPDEILESSPQEILDYYFRTRGGARPLNEAKLLLLGWGGAGKTSLVNRLVHNRFDPDEKRTEGIAVSQWEVTLDQGDQVRLNVWDFGGQEIMHATHQFFLTTRSLYLVVLNGRAGSADSDAEYWLRIVDSFAPGSPVVVALNQITKDPFDLDETGLRQKFPNIRRFVRTDCAPGPDGLGIAELRDTILAETDGLPDLRVKFPAAWFDIKTRLASMSENYLTFDAYRQICRDLGETESQAQEQLANYLNCLGIALNYRDDPRLRDTHVLNPDWVTDGIYSILNSRLVAERAGEITAHDLAAVLDEQRYPRERHAFLLELMRKFELCFAYADDADRYLVAELLPKQQPDEVVGFPIDESLQFEYRYPVLPEGVLPRFIVRSHILSASQPRWRTGVILRWEDNRALVRADIHDQVVRIAVDGPREGRRRLLAVIRSDFEHIHRNYRFPVDAFVPIPGHALSVAYEKLLAAERARMPTFPEYVDGQFVDVDVSAMLDGVDVSIRPARDRRSTHPLPARIFISYSHRDEAYREALVSHLKVLQQAGLVDVWHDRRLDPGDEWKGEIDRALDEADVVLLLVSADFLSSDYCNDVELPRALARHKRGESKVVPVIVRDVNWHLSEIAGLQALPPDGKAIASSANADTAWRSVSEGLEKLILGFAP